MGLRDILSILPGQCSTLKSLLPEQLEVDFLPKRLGLLGLEANKIANIDFIHMKIG